MGVTASLPTPLIPTAIINEASGRANGYAMPVELDDALQQLTGLLTTDLEACNCTIVARMDSPVALIPQLAAHIVAAGGKRLRPLLTLAAARLCGYPGMRHVALAACVEFIHTATLLHDDVVDESQLRRGSASANAVFGNQASVLVGDFLFARAFQLMVEDGSLQVLAVLSRAAATIAEGEVLQLVTQNDLSTSEDRYLEVIQGKTAALFAAACQVGAIVADRPKPRRPRSPPTAATLASPSSWSTTPSTTPPTRRSWVRPSATTSARARSPCRCWPPTGPAARPTTTSGTVPSRTANSSRPTLSMRWS